MALYLPEWVMESLITNQERYWNPILRDLDPALRLIRPMGNPPADMERNRWHIGRIANVNGEIVECYIPIQGPAGEFREMDEAMLDALKRMDAHSERNQRLWREDVGRRASARAREKERQRDDRITSMAERIYSKENASVRIPRDI